MRISASLPGEFLSPLKRRQSRVTQIALDRGVWLLAELGSFQKVVEHYAEPRHLRFPFRQDAAGGSSERLRLRAPHG